MNDKELDKLLDQWEAPETPPWLKTKVMQAVREEESATAGSPWLTWWRQWSSPQWVLAATAALLLGLMAVTALNRVGDTADNMATLDSAFDSFASFSDEELISWGEDPF